MVSQGWRSSSATRRLGVHVTSLGGCRIPGHLEVNKDVKKRDINASCPERREYGQRLSYRPSFLRCASSSSAHLPSSTAVQQQLHSKPKPLESPSALLLASLAILQISISREALGAHGNETKVSDASRWRREIGVID